MLSPGLAKAWESLALVETRVMPLKVGVVVSRTTWVLSSVAVTGGTLIACKVQYLDAERGIGILSSKPFH